MARRPAVSRRTIWVDLLLYPSHTLPTAAAPVVVGAGLAVHDGVFRPLPMALGFLASWLIHTAGVFTDNYDLIAHHSELREHPELLDALDQGSLTFARLRAAIITCLVLALVPGPYLLHVAGFPAVVLGVVGILASLGYSLGRYSMTRLGVADAAFFVMFGIVAVAGTYYVQAAAGHLAGTGFLFAPVALPLSALVAGLPVGGLVTNVLLIDDLRDRRFDILKGWRTPPIRFGVRGTRVEFAAFTSLAFLMPLWFWLGLGFSPWVLLTLLTLPEAVAVVRTIWTRDRFEDLFPMTPRAARLALAHSVLLAIGLAIH